jgi:hypothetical protein
MEKEERKEKAFEVRDEIHELAKNASKFYKKVTGIDLSEELPQILILPTSEIGISVSGLQEGNKIIISKEWEDYGRKIVEGITYHEFFHWAVWRSDLRSNFNYLQFYKDHEYNFSPHLRLLLIKEIPEYYVTINSIEEGAAEFFAAKLISKNENEIPKNIFYIYFHKNISNYYPKFDPIYYEAVKTVIKEVYFTYQKVNAESLKETESQIQKLIDKCYDLFPAPMKWYALHNIGRTTVLFAYEIYKKENKNVKDLLKDLTFSPWETVDIVVKEIKNDKNGELLKNTILDFSKGFEEDFKLFEKHLRNE